MADEELTNEAPLQSDQVDQADQVKAEDPSDKMTPDHPRFKQVLERAKQAEDKATYLQQQIEDIRQDIRSGRSNDDDDLSSEEKAALERINSNLRKNGFLTKDEAREMVTRELNSERRANEYRRLEGNYSGKDGYPKFDSVDVQSFADERGYSNLEEAYFGLHRQAIIEVEARKRANMIVPSSEKPANSDRSIDSQINAQDVSQMSDEDYEKNRSKILAAMKAGASK